MDYFRVNLFVDWQRRIVQLQDPPRGNIRFTIQLNPYNKFIGDYAMAVTITDTQKVLVSIEALDAKGNPATLDGIPVWTVSDSSIITAEIAADGLSAQIIAGNVLGNAQVSITADADLGAGFTPITGLLDVTVIGGEAVTLAVSVGVPTEQ